MANIKNREKPLKHQRRLGLRTCLPLAEGRAHFQLRVVGWYFSIFPQNFDRTFCKQTVKAPRYAASDLGLHCLPTSHKKDARLI